MLGQIILQIVLIVLNAVFTCAEIAVIQANPAKIDKLAEEGNKKAKKLQKLSDNPTKFLATIQVAITLSGFIGAAFAADNFADRIIKLTNEAGLEEYSELNKSLECPQSREVADKLDFLRQFRQQTGFSPNAYRKFDHM